jgi:hypothetical protein
MNDFASFLETPAKRFVDMLWFSLEVISPSSTPTTPPCALRTRFYCQPIFLIVAIRNHFEDRYSHRARTIPVFLIPLDFERCGLLAKLTTAFGRFQVLRNSHSHRDFDDRTLSPSPCSLRILRKLPCCHLSRTRRQAANEGHSLDFLARP